MSQKWKILKIYEELVLDFWGSDHVGACNTHILEMKRMDSKVCSYPNNACIKPKLHKNTYMLARKIGEEYCVLYTRMDKAKLLRWARVLLFRMKNARIFALTFM
jgi:hypothetical protein